MAKSSYQKLKLSRSSEAGKTITMLENGILLYDLESIVHPKA